jgi:hypothetical protein
MKAARFRLGASENPQGNQGRQLCWRPGIIESAEEPDFAIGFISSPRWEQDTEPKRRPSNGRVPGNKTER